MDYTVQEIDAETNTVEFRKMTAQEIAACEAEAEKVEQAKIDEQRAKVEAKAKREAALAKLAALGLTTDDLSALGL